jgi:hypothetical protein
VAVAVEAAQVLVVLVAQAALVQYLFTCGDLNDTQYNY